MKRVIGDTPFFSVVIPTLNEEKYLPKLLRCLSQQIEKDLEVIVVDGQSEDHTAAMAGGFRALLPSLTVIRANKRHVSYQRNVGAQRAEGEVLVFLDADAQIPAHFLSHIHHYLLEHQHCRLLTTWMKPDSNSQADHALTSIANALFELAKTVNKPLMGGFNVIIKKSTFQRVHGFDEKPTLAEDHDLAQRLLKSNIILHILKEPKIIVSFRRFRREGTINLLRKYAIATSKFLVEGPITEQLFDYPMGGNIPPLKHETLQFSLKQHIKKLKTYLQ